MLSFFKGIFSSPKLSQPVETDKSATSPSVFVFRGGEAVPPDEAFFARFSGDIERMLAALDVITNPIDRHFLLQTIVQEAYRERAQPKMAHICSTIAEKHLDEFPGLHEALLLNCGVLPRVSTFQHYATLLTERGEFERAMWVCQQAMSYGLQDNTKSGYEGRIQRIQKAQARRSA